MNDRKVKQLQDGVANCTIHGGAMRSQTHQLYHYSVRQLKDDQASDSTIEFRTKKESTMSLHSHFEQDSKIKLG